MNQNINLGTPIACLTVGQFIDVFRKVQEAEPIPPKKELPKFLTVPQLAELTGYSVSTINMKNCRKEIPGSKKLNGRVLFDSSVIIEWINSGSVKTKTERLNELEEKFKNTGGRKK